MRLKFVVSAAVTVLIVSGATAGWAKKQQGQHGQKSEGSAVPDSINRQFQWEDKVVGPKDKGVDHDKIAAMQEQARREEAARKNDAPKRASRAQGVEAPASATLPTMDIEKPTAAVSRKPARKTYAGEPPRHKDALDNLLNEEGGKPGSDRSRSGGGLGSILAVDDKPAAAAPGSAPSRAIAKKSKKPHRRRD